MSQWGALGDGASWGPGFSKGAPSPGEVAVWGARRPRQPYHLRSILLLAEQGLRAGLEAALARRSAFDLVLSWADSVPFMHRALGRPRLCPF